MARRVRANGVELSVFEWAGASPPVLLVHATGMHARCWDAVVARLPDVRVLAVELRGHGRSERHPPYTWPEISRDVGALCEVLGLRDVIAVGHSIGGFCIAWNAAEHPGWLRAVVLIDPVIFSPETEAARAAEPATEEHFTARRRARFASPDEMIERFAKRPPYSGWRPEVLRAYCEHGLIRGDDGEGYLLACPPQVEAAVYSSRRGGDIHARLARIAVPTTVLRAPSGEAGARFDFSRSPTWAGLASAIPGAVDVFLPECSHFIPMEVPERVAETIAKVRAATSRGGQDGVSTAGRE